MGAQTSFSTFVYFSGNLCSNFGVYVEQYILHLEDYTHTPRHSRGIQLLALNLMLCHPKPSFHMGQMHDSVKRFGSNLVNSGEWRNEAIRITKAINNPPTPQSYPQMTFFTLAKTAKSFPPQIYDICLQFPCLG